MCTTKRETAAQTHSRSVQLPNNLAASTSQLQRQHSLFDSHRRRIKVREQLCDGWVKNDNTNARGCAVHEKQLRNSHSELKAEAASTFWEKVRAATTATRCRQRGSRKPNITPERDPTFAPHIPARRGIARAYGGSGPPSRLHVLPELVNKLASKTTYSHCE